ncbi:MAG: hypothetical protein LBS55_13195 [Prevotellaceae bacterium]|jgi:PhoPQ-activated pathogenicity-related protein|nr:hypothetical protein [Prevotellaceae bacterium]
MQSESKLLHYNYFFAEYNDDKKSRRDDMSVVENTYNDDKKSRRDDMSVETVLYVMHGAPKTGARQNVPLLYKIALINQLLKHKSTYHRSVV